MAKLTAKTTIFIIAFLFASLVNISSATIIDTNHDSFIDDATGLEWMDFGVNNEYTYIEVITLLSEGQLFNGWRLPTETEALDLWYNAFLINKASFSTDYRKNGLVNDFYLHDSSLNSLSGAPSRYASIWDNVFGAMGYNIWQKGTAIKQKLAHGFFINDDGNVSILRYQNITNANNFDWVSSYGAMGQYNFLKEKVIDGYSTMLIRVPEPSTLATFVLGMIGLVLRRLKRNSDYFRKN